MPTPPSSGLLLWLEPETLPAGSYGDPVDTWPDNSRLDGVTPLSSSDGSVSFLISSDKATVTDASFADALANFSVSYWYKGIDSNNLIVNKFAYATNNGGWGIFLTSGKPTYQMFGAGYSWSYTYTCSVVVNDDNWHNIVVTYDSIAGANIYIDGIVDPAPIISGTPHATVTSTVHFGVGYTALDPYGSSNLGKIGRLEVWNTTLTSGDATTLAGGGDVASGLIGKWLFSEGTGVTATDIVTSRVLTFTEVLWNNSVTASFFTLPTLVPSGTMGESPGLKFIATSTLMHTNVIGDPIVVLTSHYSIFVVAQLLADAPLWAGLHVHGIFGTAESFWANGNLSGYSPGSSGPLDIKIKNLNAVMTVYTPGILGVVADGSNTVFYSGDLATPLSNSSVLGAESHSFPYLGGSTVGVYPWYGNISEVLVYNRTLSPSEITIINNYFVAKYGLPPLTLTLTDSISFSDSTVKDAEKILVDSITSSDTLAFARAQNVSDSMIVSDSFTLQSNFIAPVRIPVVENLVNQLAPAEVKTYYQIVE